MSSLPVETLRHLQGAQLFVGTAIAYLFGIRRMQVTRYRGSSALETEGRCF